jgi:membrane-associated phospholipid phosphatase
MTVQRKAAPVERADREITSKVNHRRDSWQMRLVGVASDIGDQPEMRLLCAATIVLAIARRDGRLATTGFKMLAAHTVATWAKTGVKAVVDRTRPDSGDDPQVQLGDSDRHQDTSFPSGHSAGVVSVAEVVARSYPEHALAARAAALAVATVQVPRGTHYVGDVLAGALIGVVAEHATDAAWNNAPEVAEFFMSRTQLRGAVERSARLLAGALCECRRT